MTVLSPSSQPRHCHLSLDNPDNSNTMTISSLNQTSPSPSPSPPPFNFSSNSKSQSRDILFNALCKLKNAIKLHKFTHELHEIQIEMELNLESFNQIREWFNMFSTERLSITSLEGEFKSTMDSNGTKNGSITNSPSTSTSPSLNSSSSDSVSTSTSVSKSSSVSRSPLVINVTLNEMKPCWLVKKQNLEKFIGANEDERFKNLFDDLHARLSNGNSDDEGEFEGSRMGIGGDYNETDCEGIGGMAFGNGRRASRGRMENSESNLVTVPEAVMIILHSLYFQYDCRKQLFFAKAICSPGFP